MTTAPVHKRPSWIGTGLLALLLGLILLASLDFVRHAFLQGLRGLTQDVGGASRFHSDSMIANIGIFAHMMTGAVITLLAPLQIWPGLRRRWPALHRWSGRMIVGAACAAATGGLVYMAMRGTIGGPQMTLAFTVYGLLVALCAVQALRHARARDWPRHRDWALRLFVLCIASFLYRVHYGLWLAIFGDTAITPDFDGGFDRVNIWAFFVPYLLIVELVLLSGNRGLFAALQRRRSP